jgi:hypothetical protein
MRALFLALSLLVVACSIESPAHSDFRIGASREEIRSQYGAPIRTQTLSKQGQHIWGAIEGYWEEIPNGSTVEIWVYSSWIKFNGADESSVQTGNTELYFVDSSDTVTGIGFHIEGVVYETNGEA